VLPVVVLSSEICILISAIFGSAFLLASPPGR
jgi:hypothetical protein